MQKKSTAAIVTWRCCHQFPTQTSMQTMLNHFKSNILLQCDELNHLFGKLALYTSPHWAPSVVLVMPLSSTNFTFIAYRCKTSWMQCILHSTRMFLQVSRSRERSSQNLTKKSSKTSLGYLLKSIVFGWWRWSMENTQFSKFYLAMIHTSALVVLDINMGYSMIHALDSFVRCVI